MGKIIKFCFVLFLYLSSIKTNANQSSVGQRTSLNSVRTTTTLFSGVWGFHERANLNAYFAYSKTPIPSVSKLDQFYGGGIGTSYGVDTLAFDVGATYSKSPLALLTTTGGSLGVTYIYIPDNQSRDHSKQALYLLHYQSYEKPKQVLPLFWVRGAYSFNTLKSRALPEGNDTGYESAFAADFSAPLTASITLTLGTGFYGYDDRKKFFTLAANAPTTLGHAFLGSTVQGLPKEAYSASLMWQLGIQDTFLPRYQGTVLNTSLAWVHTGVLAWRHRMLKSFYMTPALEVSHQGDSTVAGFSLDFLYML